MWNNWILDVTTHRDEAPCFCPYEDDGTIVTGMNMIASKSPGRLIGIVHFDGQEAVEQWVKENPNWHELYSA